MKDYDLLGSEILSASVRELYISMPFLDEALFSLIPTPNSEYTHTIATDGETLFFNGSYLSDRYLRSPINVNRMYIHTILHCMLQHLSKKKGRDLTLWDLACDVAVESIIDSMEYESIKGYSNSIRQTFYGRCRAEMRVLTAEAIYKMLQEIKLEKNEIMVLTRSFFEDEHTFWERENKPGEKSSDELDNHWKDVSSKVQTNMTSGLSNKSDGGEAILEQVRVAARDDLDYRAFLRKFAVHREILKCDDGSFDPTFYVFGLERYGNMPLIEPLETKEEKRIEDFVIAVDTSMSTKGEIVRNFLRCTYSVLRSRETFSQRLNIHIIQCDDIIRSDTLITSMVELEDYMSNVNLKGGSSTDFRPVFSYIEMLKKSGALTSLRGMIYFTDGVGLYPERRPNYEVAFALSEEPPESIKIPPWIIRLNLGPTSLDITEEEERLITETIIEEHIAELPQL